MATISYFNGNIADDINKIITYAMNTGKNLLLITVTVYVIYYVIRYGHLDSFENLGMKILFKNRMIIKQEIDELDSTIDLLSKEHEFYQYIFNQLISGNDTEGINITVEELIKLVVQKVKDMTPVDSEELQVYESSVFEPTNMSRAIALYYGNIKYYVIFSDNVSVSDEVIIPLLFYKLTTQIASIA